MYNLPKDLEEEVLSRVPVTSMRRIRLTCKKWNTLSKGMHFAKKHIDQATSKKYMVVMMMHYKLYLMHIHLNDNVESSCIQREAKLVSLDDSYGVDFVNVFHCDGLLLCITRDYTKLVVWNPYLGQTRCLEPTLAFYRLNRYSYAIGYDNSNHNYKILIFVDWTYEWTYETPFFEIKIYDLNSDSWRVLDVPPPEALITFYHHGVSLKGDTYWIAEDKHSQVNDGAFLVCFDFTKERFGPLLPLPFEWCQNDTATLSSVKEEKLAVMFQPADTFMLEMEIWITTKIEPNAVSWNSKVFLAMDMRPLMNIGFVLTASFFIDEEKEVAVVFDKEKEYKFDPLYGVAYIIGVDGSLKEVHLGDSPDESCYPLVCSYVPSLVQLNDGKAKPSTQPKRRVSTRTRIPNRKFMT